MKSFIFYTGEGSTFSPTNEMCENFQVLGFESGFSKELALQTLLENNSWISKYGFSRDIIQCRQVV